MKTDVLMLQADATRHNVPTNESSLILGRYVRLWCCVMVCIWVIVLGCPLVAFAFDIKCHEELTRKALGKRCVDEIVMWRINSAHSDQDYFHPALFVPSAHFTRDPGEEGSYYEMLAFTAGLEQIRTWRRELDDYMVKRDPMSAQVVLGKILHATQDLFSHSNLVDGCPGDNAGNAVRISLVIQLLTSREGNADYPSLYNDLHLGCFPGPCAYSHARENKDDCDKSDCRNTEAMKWAQIATDAVTYTILNEWPNLPFSFQGPPPKTENMCKPLPPTPSSFLYVETLTSWDPNDKVGPVGVGTVRYLRNHGALSYTIFLENQSAASLPAQVVEIRDVLDPTIYDLSSVEFGPVSFGSIMLVPPYGVHAFVQDVDLRPEKNLIVRIGGRMDESTGTIVWTMVSIDPVTGGLVEDPYGGFLPPNATPPEGEGSVVISVRPRAELGTGATLANSATIVFDSNAPIDTPTWINTIDISPPESQVVAMPESAGTCGVLVSWSGSDAGSGIKSYTIYVAENGGDFRPWLIDTGSTSAVFEAERHTTLAFYSVASDSAGNVEAAATVPDAVTIANCEVGNFISNLGGGEEAGNVVLHWRAAEIVQASDFKVLRAEVGGIFVLMPVEPLVCSEGGVCAYVDSTTVAGHTYQYRLGYGANTEWMSEIMTVKVAQARFALLECGPNPTAFATRMRYSVPSGERVFVEIFDLAGRRVRSMEVDAARGGAGTCEWDLRDDRRTRVSSGVYFMRLRAGSNVASHKISVLR